MNAGARPDASRHPSLLLLPKLLLLLAGLLGPGYALARLLDVRRGPTVCFAGSAVTLYVVVLLLNFSGIPITLGALAGILGVVTITALIVATRRERTRPLSDAGSEWHAPLARMGAWTPLYLICVVVIVVRAWHEPLAGPDTEFRWSFLAEQMLHRGSLGFYPPQTAADFVQYFWVESIPPEVSALYAWCYACAGSTAAVWTVPVVLLQVWSVHQLAWRIGELLGGERAARFACLAIASGALLTWSILIAQETGLTTIALLGIIASLLEWQTSRAPKWAIAAAVFSVLGAAAREYGLVFPVLATIALLVMRANRTSWIGFLSVVVPLTLIWPLRTLVLTGNPFFSLPFLHLPTNERFVALFQASAEVFGTPLRTVDGWLTIARYLVSFAPAAIVGWLALAIGERTAWRRNTLLLAAVAVALGLWFMSVRYTAGGLFYSLRVAAPAVALGAATAGVWLAASSARKIAAFGIALLVVASVPAIMALPVNPWRTPWREWPIFVSSPVPTIDPAARIVRDHRVPGVVLSDSSGFQRRFAQVGIQVVPFWSPQAAWIFDGTLSPAAAVEQWRSSGIRYVAVTSLPGNRPGFDYLRAHAAWMRPPFRWTLIGQTEVTAVFSIEAEP